MTNALPFAALSAAGNRYAAVDGRERALDWNALASAISDPATGVGTDGLLVLAPGPRLRVFNVDGGEAELSGNGLVLMAKFALERDLVRASDGAVVFETAAGPRSVAARMDGELVVGGEVTLDAPSGLDPIELDVDGRCYEATALSLGNPHLAVHVDRSPGELELAPIAAAARALPCFPEGVNVELVHRLGPDRVTIRIDERGVGETASSGTGGAAAAVAAIARGDVAPPARVEMPGGTSRIRWDRGEPGGPVRVETRAVELFQGVWPL